MNIYIYMQNIIEINVCQEIKMKYLQPMYPH